MDTTIFEKVHPFVIAFGIAFIIGIERERSHPSGTLTLGVRTFSLVGLLGALAAYLHDTGLAIVLALFAFSAILLGYWRSTRRGTALADVGLTTEITAGVVFCLGYISLKQPYVAASVGVLVLAVLVFRKWIHRFSREQLRPQEITAAVTMLVLIIGILPLLSDSAIDPWGFFHPRRLMILITLLALVQFLAYVAVRLLGPRRGLSVMGFVGGLVSSTVVTLEISRKVQLKKLSPNLGASTIGIAISGSLLELIFLIAIAAPTLLTKLLAPVGGAALVGILLTLFWGNQTQLAEGESLGGETSPLEIKSVIKLGFVFAIILGLTGFVRQSLGAHATGVVSFVGGLFEVHAVSLASVSLFKEGGLSDLAATQNIYLALLASLLSKLGIVLFISRGRMLRPVLTLIVLMLATAAVLNIAASLVQKS